MSSRKRRLEDEAPSDAASKKAKSDASTPQATATPPLSGAALIAQKKAEIAAMMASFSASRPPPPPVSIVPSPVIRADASEIARKVAEAKRKVAEAASKAALSSNPYMTVPQVGKKKPQEPAAPQGAGLKMAAHPLLLDTAPAPAPASKKDKYKPMVPKFASIKANTRNVPTPPPPPVAEVVKLNPYASGTTGGEGPKERVGRNFRFNQKGKYVSLGNQMRQDAQLDALKQRIAESARKAGFDSEFEVLEKNIRRPAPPAAEWWDANLLPNKKYDDLALGIRAMNIRNADSPITIYVQHPIPIPAPADKNKVELKPAKLTPKEQKKLRKQRRQADLQDKRDRIKMGLMPPDAPKVRLSNLMKVLTTDAVQDPTKVEARVRREVAMRKHTHEKMNAERKLTEEQRKEKIETKKAEEERTKGLLGALYRVKTLSDPAQRFKVRKNAEQDNLTGICIMNPAFCIVYVEGAPKFMKHYKGLLTRRIDWTQAARDRVADDEVLAENGEDDAMAVDSAGPSRIPVPSPTGEEISLDDNRCDLIWEGPLGERAFRNFRPKSCPTDSAAKEALGPKLASWWDMAKNWKPAEEEE